MSNENFKVGDFVLITGAGRIARVVKRYLNKYGQVQYNVVAMQGGGRYKQLAIYWFDLLPLNTKSIIQLIGQGDDVPANLEITAI